MKYQRKSYTTTDFYESYKQYIEPNTLYDIDLQTYKNIINDYFQYIRDEVMYNCKEFKFPCRLGTLQIIKHQPKKNLQAKVLDGTGKLQKKLVSLYTYLMTIVIIINIDSFGQRKIVCLLIKLNISSQLQEIIREIQLK